MRCREVALLTLLALLALASPAWATPVTNVTVANGSPSAAAGARTQYVVGFTTSATGGLSATAGSHIDVTFPAGTTFTGYNSATVRNVTTATNVGTCGSPSGLVIQCTLFSSATIGAGHNVTVAFNGITNPATPGTSYRVRVSTTADTDLVDSSTFSVVPANPVTALAVLIAAPSAAAGARTQYTVTFKASATGGLSPAGNSRIDVTFPTGTTFGGYNTANVTDVTTAQSVGTCGSPSGLVIQCALFSSGAIAAGHDVRITFGGITNPTPAGARTLTVSTTSDTSAVTSSPYDVVAPNRLATLTLSNNSVSAAAGARTQYVATFTASSTGGLSAAGNSRIDVTFPTGTTFAGYNTANVRDLTTSQNVGTCGSPAGLVIQCTLFSSGVINPGDGVQITFGGITNPTTLGAKNVTVSTTSDTQTETSAPFDVIAANPLTALTVSIASPSAAAGARTQYTVSFRTSATGALSPGGNSRIDVTFPTGTTFAGYNTATVTDVTTAQNVGTCGSAAGLVVQCALFSTGTIDAGHDVRITFGGITNGSAGAKTLTVSTTSDTQTVTSAPFDVIVANPLTALTVSIASPSAAAGARTQYAVSFKASATGALSPAGNSRIDVTFPTGTTFAGYNTASVTDVTTAQNVGTCGSAAGLVVQCTLFSTGTIAAGHDVRITFGGITNGSAGAKTLTVSTTSDPQTVTSSAFDVVAAGALTGVAVTVTSPAPSATTQYVIRMVTSATGALSPAGNSRIDLTFPTGTTFAGYTSASVHDLTTARNVGTCGSPSGRVIQCTLFSTGAVNAGDTVRITLTSITNPSSAGPYTLTASTTSDPPAVTSTAYQQGDAVGPDTTIDSGPSGTVTTATPTFAFSASEPGTTFQCRVDTAAFAPCTSPFTTETLTDGPHTFEVRAVDAAGNPDTVPATRSFTVAASATPTPTPVSTPGVVRTPVPTPTPQFNKTVVAKPISGKVRIRRPGSNEFVDLDATAGIPVGSTVDVKTGVVELTSVSKAGQQKAQFHDGMFKLTQTASTTDLTLNEPLAACPKRKASAAASKPKSRRLWGDGKGKFRTRGTYSAATVRGTVWLVQDSCAGTLTRVKQGVVSVRDDVRKKTITLRKNQRYLAKPRR